MPRDDQVAAPLDEALPVAHQVALPAVRVVEVPQLVGGLLRELHVPAHALHEQPAEGLLLGEGAARARGERAHRVRGVLPVEDEDGADGGRLALGGGEPAGREVGQAGRVGDREDDVVLLDDALVEAVGLLVGQAQRGLEDGLLPEALDLQRGAEGEVREDPDGDEHRREQHEAGEPLALSGHGDGSILRPRLAGLRVTLPGAGAG